MAMYYHIRTIIHTHNNCTRLVYIVAVATEKMSEYIRPFGPNGAWIYILHVRSFMVGGTECSIVLMYDTIMV